MAAESLAAEAQVAQGNQPEVELAAGALVHVGTCLCEITQPLGMGSFGVVWAANTAGGGDVAMKEILCRSETELSRAGYEAELLSLLTNCGAGSPGRIPLYVACSTAQLQTESFRMRLVMSRLPGEPLDRYLHERRAKLQAGASQDHCLEVSDAFRFASMLVSQLVPTLERIAVLAYHRDVNAHNILIAIDSSREQPEPEFALVDFGLAVDAVRWMDPSPRNPLGRSEWEFQDVGGDCRYWPVSAWRQFEVGCHELAGNPDLCLEYQTHLDLQGLGITALQVLVEMLPAVDTPLPAHLHELRIAWADYWEHATRFWACLLHTFRSGGDWNALKNEFIAEQVHGIIAEKLQAVRRALSATERACQLIPCSPWTANAQALLPALMLLISSGERRAAPTAWHDISKHFSTASKGHVAAHSGSCSSAVGSKARDSEGSGITSTGTTASAGTTCDSSLGPSSEAQSASPSESSNSEVPRREIDSWRRWRIEPSPAQPNLQQGQCASVSSTPPAHGDACGLSSARSAGREALFCSASLGTSQSAVSLPCQSGVPRSDSEGSRQLPRKGAVARSQVLDYETQADAFRRNRILKLDSFAEQVADLRNSFEHFRLADQTRGLAILGS